MSRSGRHTSRTTASFGFAKQRRDGGGLVEMSANRPFGLVGWPTWWLSEMEVDHATSGDPIPARRGYHDRHGCRVELHAGRAAGRTFASCTSGTGRAWPFIGIFAATSVIGPVFIHGIASRTLAGLARAAERRARRTVRPRSLMLTASRAISMRRRVVVTGIGAITPIGITGRQPVGRRARRALGGAVAHPLRPVDLPQSHRGRGERLRSHATISRRKRAKRLDRFGQFSVVARAAWRSRTRSSTSRAEDRERIGAMMGTALGGVGYAEEQLGAVPDAGAARRGRRRSRSRCSAARRAATSRSSSACTGRTARTR